MSEKYRHSYDDPYRMLAASVAVKFNVACAKRMLEDKDYIRQIIQAEVRDNIDVPGMFSDCITTELIASSQKIPYRNALNDLGLFFYQQLDISRFRKELKDFYAEFGIEL